MAGSILISMAEGLNISGKVYECSGEKKVDLAGSCVQFTKIKTCTVCFPKDSKAIEIYKTEKDKDDWYARPAPARLGVSPLILKSEGDFCSSEPKPNCNIILDNVVNGKWPLFQWHDKNGQVEWLTGTRYFDIQKKYISQDEVDYASGVGCGVELDKDQDVTELYIEGGPKYRDALQGKKLTIHFVRSEHEKIPRCQKMVAAVKAKTWPVYWDKQQKKYVTGLRFAVLLEQIKENAGGGQPGNTVSSVSTLLRRLFKKLRRAIMK